jgi:signal transduction histidine kinase
VAGDQAETIRSYLGQAGGWIGKLTAVRRDGSRFVVMLSASTIELEGQETACVVGSFVDMTYRERLNAMLWERIDRLQALREIDRGILAERSIREIGEAALRHVRRVVPCPTASVVLFDLERNRAQMLAAVPAEEYSRFEPEARFPLTGWEEVLEALQRDGIYMIENVRRLPLPAPTLEMIGLRSPRTYGVVPLRCEGRLLGSLNLALKEAGDLTGQHQSVAREVADSLAVAIRHAQLDASIARHREQLRALTVRLAELDEARRRALASDLHDRIGQRLTALGINLNVIKAGLDVEQAPQLCSRLDDSLGLLSETTDRVRLVMADLRPPMLDDYGLLPTLRWCGEQLAARTDIHVVVEGSEPDPRFPSPIEDTLVRIAQEALTNVAKHAKASQVTIALSHEGDRIRLAISDDGGGFDPNRINGASSRHWGLLTMTERAEGLGGHCRVESEPGEGTRVVVEVTR